MWVRDGGELAIWVNQEDHLTLISRRRDHDVPAAFGALCELLQELERVHATSSMAIGRRLGFVSVSPANIGTALRASLTLRLPCLGADEHALRAVCDQVMRDTGSKSGAVVSAPAANTGCRTGEASDSW